MSARFSAFEKLRIFILMSSTPPNKILSVRFATIPVKTRATPGLVSVFFDFKITANNKGIIITEIIIKIRLLPGTSP